MRIGYLHCFSGISGDMFLGALIDAGVPFEFLRKTAQSLEVGADLHFERVDRSGLSAVKVRVVEVGGNEAGHQESGHAASDEHRHKRGLEQEHERSHSHPHTHGHDAAHDSHAGSTANHRHVHGRSLSAIRELIEQAPLGLEVKKTAIHAFELLAASEAKMHNVPMEQVHFHEVGAVDAIVDIVCGCAGAFSLGVDQWICSPLNVGSGMVRCAHGVFPVPAPATLDLLLGVPIYTEGPEGERVTPTGAALVRALGCSFEPMPRMVAGSTGYGAGSRNPKDYPNVLRVTLGESIAPVDDATDGQTIAVLETAIDDSTPQVIGHVMEAALAAGAHDVMTAPVHMKKNRTGTLITILCEPENTKRFCELLFRETSTIGVRTRLDRRQCLQRDIVAVETEWGQVRLKIARLNGVVMNSAPEFEDCRRLAQLHNVALKEIQRAAVIEYMKRTEDIERWESGVSART